MTIILGMIHVDQCYPDPSDPHDHHRWTNYWLRVTAIENGHMSRQVLKMMMMMRAIISKVKRMMMKMTMRMVMVVAICKPSFACRCKEWRGTQGGMFFTDTKGAKSSSALWPSSSSSPSAS